MELSYFQITALTMPPPVEDVGWRLFGVAVLVLLNALFVAAEFAMVRVRAGGWEDDDFGGRRRGARARKMLDNPQPYLSAAQLGVTLTSLGLGWAGEPFVARLLQPLFHAVGVDQAGMVSVISFLVAFLFLAFYLASGVYTANLSYPIPNILSEPSKIHLISPEPSQNRTPLQDNVENPGFVHQV